MDSVAYNEMETICLILMTSFGKSQNELSEACTRKHEKKDKNSLCHKNNVKGKTLLFSFIREGLKAQIKQF